MEKDIFSIIEKKEFIELTREEREEIKDYVSSEEEYNQMKSVLLQVARMPNENPAPKKETKESLDALFDQNANKAPVLWYNAVLAVVVPKNKPVYRQPLIQTAALIVILFMVVPIFKNNLQAENKQLAQVELIKEETISDETIEKNDLILEENEQAEQEEHAQAEAFASLDDIVVSEPIASEILMDEIDASSAVSSMHPDGVFVGGNKDLALSQSVEESADLMSLLTAAF